MPIKLAVGDTVRLKKQHPCGGLEWQITRIGADIGLRCLTCGHKVLLARSKLERRIKAVVSSGGEPSDPAQEMGGEGSFER